MKIAIYDPYKTFVESLPDNQKDSINYNIRRYWELNGQPKDFQEAINKGMYVIDPGDGLYHANTVAYNQYTGNHEFMKSMSHPTVKKELDWFYSDDGDNFRKENYLDVENGNYIYKPVPQTPEQRYMSIAAPAPTTPTQSTGLKFNDNEMRMRQMYMESGGNRFAKSKAGALGLYQIMNGTHKGYKKASGRSGDLTNPEYNRMVRDWVMNQLTRTTFYKNTQNPLVAAAKQYAAYNWGQGNLVKYLTKLKDSGKDIYNSLDWIEGLPKETRDYVNFIVLGKDLSKKTNKDFTSAVSSGKIYKNGGFLKGSK